MVPGGSAKDCPSLPGPALLRGDRILTSMYPQSSLQLGTSVSLPEMRMARVLERFRTYGHSRGGLCVSWV